MKQIPCIVIDGCFSQFTSLGILNIGNNGEFENVEIISLKKQGAPKDFLRRSYIHSDRLNELVLFYIVKDEDGNYIEPKGYDEYSIRKPKCDEDKFEYVYFPSSVPEENYCCGYCEYETGKVIVPPIYQNAIYFSGEIAEVMKNGKWGTIDINGDICLEPVYDAIGGNYSQVI